MSRDLWAFCALWLVLASVAPAAAQQTAELTGTFVRYVAVSPNGVMVANDAPDGRPCTASCHCDPDSISCVEGRGMRYSEDGTATATTCDAFYPASVETFTVVAARADSSVLRGHNDLSSAAMVAIEGPTQADRGIHWAGTLHDSAGQPALRIDHDWEYAIDDRAVRLTTTVTNLGTTSIFELYLLRNADPNFVGLCPSSGTGSASTSNDVVRQPPSGGDALVIAGAGDVTTAGAYFVLGIGAHDDRARASTGGRENSDAVGEWITPHDADGALADVAIDLIFHETEIAAGDSTTFELFYVWGTSAGDVAARFDALGTGGSTCLGVRDGVGCSSGSGAIGVCHASSCCTGCWDATGGRCQIGTSGARCGIAGRACVSCSDGIACTSDVCGLGVCSNPWAPVATACEDGAFCTVGETCDGLGHCGSGRTHACDDGASCTADTCNEASDRCEHALTTGCLVGGECVAVGVRPHAYPCLVCDSARSTSDWSNVASGTSCGASRCTSGAMVTGGTCDGAGACMAPRPRACASGVCRADGAACEDPCTATSCPAGQRCADTMRCVSLADDGAMCGAGDECRSTHCVDGVCCAEACDGLCAACDLPHQAGRCVAIPASTDPARECPGSAVCDGHGACVTPAMPDAGVRRDAAMSADAATTPAPARTGCGCVVPGRSSHRGTGLFALAMLGVLALRRRRLRRGAALAVIALVLGVPSVVLATTLSGSLGFRWDIDDNVGRPGAILDGTSDAYDGCYSLAVGGTSYAVPSGSASTLSAGGRQVDLPPMSVGSGLVAERHIYVPTTATWARLIEVVANPTASAVTTTITISGNLGSDSSTRLMATSSGDLVLDTSDTWFATDDVDGSGDPSLAHVFRGVGGAVGVTSVTLVTDQITYVYGVTIPAHGRVAILHFAVQASTQALAQAAALQVSMLGPETHASADSWASSIVNWAIGMDTCASASDGSSCTSWGSATGICHGHTCCSGCWDGASCLPGYDVAACGVVGGACRACADGNTCTDDVCRSGVCSNPSASASLACDDGRYCTAHDHCNGSGGCTPGTTSPCDDHVSCTIDSCDETTDACTNVFSMGCTIGGECVGVGEHHVAYPCLVCDPTRNATDWSMEASGAVCGSARCSGGHVFTAGTCDAAGTCSAPRPTACASMTCAPDRMSCEDVCTSTSCPPGTRCGAALHCIPVLGLGSNCTMNEECVTSRCADGLCCDRACDGTCEACDLPGREGTCRAIPTGTDPAAECGALHVCDGHGACVSRVATDAAHSPDAGGIEAGPVDAGAVPPRAAGSCGCAVPGPSESRAAVTGLLVGLALLVLRRRRAW